MAEPKFITVDLEPPPEALFDAQIDVAATLAANPALLRNAPLASHYTQRWLHYVRTRSLLQVGNRIAVGAIAEFVECELRGVDAMRGEGPLPWRSPRLIEAGARRAVDESGGGSSAAGGSGGESGEVELESENVAKERRQATARRVKAMGDMFGPRPKRGQNVLAVGHNQEDESLTLPDDVASLYVVSQLVDAFTTRASGEGEVGGLPGLGEATWAKQREKWEKAGLDQTQQARCEGELQMRALRGLPFFVLKNGGTYYSGTMLKYVLGMENHQYVLFRMLRDVNRRGRKESAGGESEGEAAEAGGEGGAAESGGDESEGGSGGSEESEGARVRRRLLRQFNRDHDRWEAEGGFFSVGQDVRTDAPTVGGGVEKLGDTEGGANDAEAGTSAQPGARGESGGGGTSLARVQRTADRGHEMQLVLRAAAANTPAELVEVVAASTRAFGLPLQETLTVATLQVAQTSSPEEADEVWCAAVRQLAVELGKAGEVPRESAGEEKGAPGEDFSGILGEVLEEDFFVPRRWGAKRKRSYDLAPAHTAPSDKGEWIDRPDAEEDEWVAADEDAYRTDRPGLDVRTSVPFKGLGEIGRYYRDFSIPDQVVTMQASYDPELENRFKGRHNLWVLSALSRLFPQSVPVTKTPGSETLFAVELVKEAVPGMTENAAQLGTAALVALEGVVVTPVMRVAGGHMALRRLARGVWASKRLNEVVQPGPVAAGWAALSQEERTLRTNVLLSLTLRETQARAEIAASVAEEELRRMQPDVLDQAGGEEGEEEAGGKGSGEEEG